MEFQLPAYLIETIGTGFPLIFGWKRVNIFKKIFCFVRLFFSLSFGLAKQVLLMPILFLALGPGLEACIAFCLEYNKET